MPLPQGKSAVQENMELQGTSAVQENTELQETSGAKEKTEARKISEAKEKTGLSETSGVHKDTEVQKKSGKFKMLRFFHRESSLNKRLNMLLAVCLIPFAILLAYLMYSMYSFSEQYDRIVDNITGANVYNLDFKENMDYTMYIIVVNSGRSNELVETDPHEQIAEARRDFTKLANHATDSTAKTQLQRIVKTLNTLEDRVQEIEDDAQKSGMYDENLNRLDLNIRILTELIQDQIQEYIYHEATNLENLRDGVRSDVRQTLQISLIVGLAAMAAALLISRQIVRRMTSGISQLRMVARKAGHGDFTAHAEIDESDEELSELGQGFNQMVDRIGNLVEDIRVEQLNLRATELKLLQAQINPHFLYNTLDTIIWLAEAGQTEQVIMMVTALSDFFRTTLSKGLDYITVKEEESHIRSYLKIQQFRYQDILEYEINIPEEMYQYRILKLTLQPLVENALYHGIKNRRGLGHIRVTGHVEDGRLVFLVTDDGQGMTPERLSEVQEAMNRRESGKGEEREKSGSGSGFGLYNVMERIRLNYGPGYGIWISSKWQEGTEVMVEIPAVKDRETVSQTAVLK